LTVPERVGSLTIELEVLSGSLGAMILPSHGLLREYYGHVFPQAGRTFPKGKYLLMLPSPTSGTWSVTLTNVSAWLESDRSLVSTAEATYSLSVRFERAAMMLARTATGQIVVDVVNEGARLEEAELDCAVGSSGSLSGTFLPTGLPHRITIDVPPETAT